MVQDLIRDSTFGQIVNYLSKGRFLPYADQRADFVIPSRFLLPSPEKKRPAEPASDAVTLAEDEKVKRQTLSPPDITLTKRESTTSTLAGDAELSYEPTLSRDYEARRQTLSPPEKDTKRESTTSTIAGDPEKRETLFVPDVKTKRDSTTSTLAGDIEAKQGPEETNLDDFKDPFLVGWYGDDDPDNPRNWSFPKRAFTAFSISLLTFSVYIGSAIYTPAIPGIMVHFGVSLTQATLGLTLYVLAYGIGPMFLSPLQELPALGRNPVYIAGLFIFVVLQIPIATATNIRTIHAFRFLTGFFGSPALATGGASMGDIFPMHQLAYVIGIWALGAVAGPITGPVIGGFAAQAESWRWPIYELIWISGFTLGFLFFLLPETYEPTILLKRARRLRKLTGNNQLRSVSEREADKKSPSEIIYEALVRPLVLAKEPMLLFANVYLGFVYAVFYLWFEAFPLVFTDIYHFNLGISGLPFLGFIVSGTITYAFYCVYQKYHMAPRYARAAEAGITLAPEARLEIGLISSIFIPTSVLIFGFASKTSVPWIVPIIGAALYLPGIFLNFQSILMYISTAYYTHAASVLAGNDLFRSTIASVFPLFGHAFFTNLGLGPGSALLAGISFLLMPVYWTLMKYGHVLRARSKYAFNG